MTISSTINQIDTLRTEAASAGDSVMVAMCDRAIDDANTLHDSDTTEHLDISDIGCSTTEYVEAICESLDCQQAEGHVRLNGRRVYAS